MPTQKELRRDTLNQDKPETLLKSALEKIVYFEARSAQLSNDLAQTKSEVERMKQELTNAAQREIDLRRVVAELEVKAARAHHDKDEAARVTEALKRERGELIGRMLDASRIHASGSPQQMDDFDLSQFIAQLRSEVLTTRDGRAVHVASVNSSMVESGNHKASVQLDSNSIQSAAVSLQQQGRLEVSREDVGRLQGGELFRGKTEETLFGFSVRELSAPDAGARVRAAERLKALKHTAAAPVLAQALHHEREPKVLVALVEALSSLAHAEAANVVVPLLSNPNSDVRIASLKALLTLDASQATPHISAALKDADKAVRRRASLLALSLKDADALALGEQAIADQDPDVRALAALILGASNAVAARPLLTRAMNDVDAKVRRTASQSLSSLLGQNVSPMAALDDLSRRREVRKLAHMPVAPVAVMPVPRVKMESALRAVANPAQAQMAPKRVAVAVLERTAVQEVLNLESVSVQLQVNSTATALMPKTVAILRSSLRGKALPDLAQEMSASPEDTMQALSSLMQKGAVVRRGLKYFVA
jgi:hypothetical protein